MNHVHCQRDSCRKHLLTLPDEPHYTSLSVRCSCGARYRVYFRNGEHVTDKVAVIDVSEATVAAIEVDPTLKPADRVGAYESLIKRAKKARESYNVAYGGIIHKAERKKEEWHTKASQEVAKVMTTKADVSSVELVNRIAMVHTNGGQALFVGDAPWDPSKMGDPIYVRRVAEKLGVAHILE